jgi:phage-related protein
MMHTLKINGSTVPDIYIDTAESFDKPKKNVETINVPGRNGDLVIDYGTFQNVLIKYPCYIHGSFESKFQALLNLLGTLQGYQRIECSNDATHYRLGIPVLPQAPDVRRTNEDGFFDLTFNCKPQRFLTSGETIINVSANQTITNPTGFDAAPELIFDHDGTYTFRFENFKTATEYVQGTAEVDGIFHNTLIIDSALMECYDFDSGPDHPNPANEAVTLSPNRFPILYGTRAINKTKITASASFRMKPNWWEL